MNCFIITGNSKRLIDKKIKELINFENETIYFDLLFNSLEEVINEATYHSLFLDKKNLIVENSDFLSDEKKSDEVDILINIVNSEDELTNIIFITREKLNNKNSIVGLLKKKNSIFDFSLAKMDINKEIIDYCKANKFTITKEAINCLKINLSNNTDLIFNELDKLFLYYDKKCEIGEHDVKKYCANIIDDNNFKFVDMVIQKKYKESFDYMEELLIKKVDPLSLFNLLVREFRLMTLYKIIQNNDNNFSDLVKIYNLKDWQLDKISRNAYNYKLSDLKRIIKILANYDYKFKTGLIDKNNFLSLLLLEIY